MLALCYNVTMKISMHECLIRIYQAHARFIDLCMGQYGYSYMHGIQDILNSVLSF